MGLPFPAIVAMFVISGAAGLVDQLCFSKYLGYIVGSTAHAVSAVLAAFMVGLSLGAHLGGKYAHRFVRPLTAYGWLEIGVALTVVVSPLAFSAITPLYVAGARAAPDSLAVLSVLRWLSAALIVIVPTTAMGATLPLLTRALAPDEPTRKRQLGALYAANTVGGALGSLGSAYLLMPAWGMKTTLFASAAASVTVGGLALLGARRHAPKHGEPSVATGTTPSSQRELRGNSPGTDTISRTEGLILAALAAVSGALVFTLEVVETHVMALIIGNSAYAFGLILAIFLVCLFFGAALAPRAERLLGTAALPVSLALTGLLLLGSMPLWDRLPALFANFGEDIVTFAGREAFRALVAFAILAIPTTLMGLTFPLLLQRVGCFTNAASWVGRLTAINTLGAVSGSLAAGYWLLPFLGAEGSLRAVAISFAAAGAATAFFAVRPRWPVLTLASMVIAASPFVARWDVLRLTSGTNVYFDGHQMPGELVFLREDVQGGVTTVVRRPPAAGQPPVTTLYTNGKFQGNDGWEMRAQRYFAHYPSLFVGDFNHALVIGLGTGTTLGTLTAYPWNSIDVVDISPAIVEAAGTYFTGPNRNALRDERVRVHIADGRNHLLLDTGSYDLISMELSSIWFAGAASLYSREYYELVAKRLEAAGIFQQWVQLHHIYESDFATILNTLREVFPHVALFYGGGQGILVASHEPLCASESRLAALERRPQFAEVLSDERSLPELLDDVLLTGEALDAFLDDQAQARGLARAEMVSTDDNLHLEYATPRGNVLPWQTREALVDHLRRYRQVSEIRALLGR